MFLDDTQITTLDMSIKPASSSCKYYFGEASFNGYTIANILSDKKYVLSTDKLFRRIKDLIDVYTIICSISIDRDSIENELRRKHRVLGDFNAFFNRKDEVEHAYLKFKGMENRPEFKEVYDMVSSFITDFLRNNA